MVLATDQTTAFAAATVTAGASIIIAVLGVAFQKRHNGKDRSNERLDIIEERLWKLNERLHRLEETLWMENHGMHRDELKPGD